MDNLSNLAVKAENVDFDTFLQLIDDVILLQSTERDIAEKLEFSGGIIKMPQKGEAIVVGDIHGDLNSLLHIFNTSNFIEKARRNEDAFMIFLGDYGDRGIYSPEVYFAVLILKKMFPQRVILMRGNHEGPKDLLAYPHDLPFHLEWKYGDKAHTVYERITCLFEHLHLTTIVNQKYVLLHGGPPSEAKSIEDLIFAREKHPVESHLEEILWNDPAENIAGTLFSPRGAGRLFGRDITNRFLKMTNTKMIIRGHEPTDDGYKFNHDGKVLTLFSRKGAPYYNQHGAYLQLNLSGNIDDAWQVKRFLKQI